MSAQTNANATLHDRLGGDANLRLIIGNFFDEIKEDPVLAPFFTNISISALRTHQAKLFRVIFGPKEERPDADDFRDYMLATHTRLFRDLGLNETHFDKVALCFVQGLQTMHIDQSVIDECVAILVPLRSIFEYGSKIAAQEKTMTKEEIGLLPKASAKTIGTEEKVALPDPAHIDIPRWLPETLGKYSVQSEVRAWTCELTDQFGEDGDLEIADVFMDMPYMNHHVYLAAFLQLAFLPHGVSSNTEELLNMVRYPRGPNNPPLSRTVWTRMISKFVQTCREIMFMDAHATMRAMEKLRSYSKLLPDVPAVKVNGVNAPHTLRRVTSVEIDFMPHTTELTKQRRRNKSKGKDHESATSKTSAFSTALKSRASNKTKKSTSSGRKSRRRVWRHLFGWIKV